MLSFRKRSPDSSQPAEWRVAAAVRGDREAAAELAAELLPRVRNLVRYLIRGDQDVDDVAQDALVAVLRGLPSYRGEGRLESWADRVVARTTFAWLRKRQAEQERWLRVARARLTSDEQPLPPDEYLARRRLIGLLDGLSFDQRHALVLHHVLGMSVPEVAQEIDVPTETVRSRLRIARLRLREAYSPLIEQETG